MANVGKTGNGMVKSSNSQRPSHYDTWLQG